MSWNPKNLSENAKIVLHYLEQYVRKHEKPACKQEFVMRDIKVNYPLFRFLFESAHACNQATQELANEGLFQVVVDLKKAGQLDTIPLKNTLPVIQARIKNGPADIVNRIPLSEIL